MSEAVVNIDINPAIDTEKAKAEYQKTGRVQIKQFFTEQTANYLMECIERNTRWYFAYNDPQGFYEADYDKVASLPDDIKARFMGEIYARATTQFQYAFGQYYITQAVELNEDPGHPLHAVEAFVNSEQYLSLMRDITGEPAIRKADSYASLYDKGHFLTNHNDIHKKHDRVAACTFGFTKNWNMNWGGHVVFFDEDGNIEQGFKPEFNTFTMFRIPQEHAVQTVSPFAGAKRYSLLSWLHR
ncbi:2OG-Fe(II) oxygenase family protein [Alteromonas sp. CYL-A6]|uniref:2OG-Fe(II) oxygenase family protein n=1 Tax=Alteromonas nitratireducens TaxID=3390813 RepID=UPI0034BBDD7D